MLRNMEHHLEIRALPDPSKTVIEIFPNIDEIFIFFVHAPMTIYYQ